MIRPELEAELAEGLPDLEHDQCHGPMIAVARAEWLGQREARRMMHGEIAPTADSDSLSPPLDALEEWFGYAPGELPSYLLRAFEAGVTSELGR